MPPSWDGGGYHVVVVLDADSESALVSDLADEPIRIPRETLERARGRIKKFKYRLLSLGDRTGGYDAPAAARAGVLACVDELRRARGNFSLEALATWAERLEAGRGKDAWASVFPRGRHLWTGLTWMYDSIEHLGTGGGLCRPLYADFLEEARSLPGLAPLADAAGRYRALGIAWTELARAALPDGVPLFRHTRALRDRKAEAFLSQGADAVEVQQAIQVELAAQAEEAAECFPLSDAQCAQLRADLADRVRALHAMEVEALAALAAAG